MKLTRRSTRVCDRVWITASVYEVGENFEVVLEAWSLFGPIADEALWAGIHPTDEGLSILRSEMREWLREKT